MFLICSYKLTKNRGGVTKYLVNKYSPCHHFMYNVDNRFVICGHSALAMDQLMAILSIEKNFSPFYFGEVLV